MSHPPIAAAALSPGSLVAVAGASARAAAGSLRRAGLFPVCADAFCDRDLVAIAHRAAACPPHGFPAALPDVLASLEVPEGTPLLLTGAMENHLPVVRTLAEKYALLTCSPDVIEKVRDPLIGKTMPQIPHVKWPETRVGPIADIRLRTGSEWLIKPRRSAGGRGIQFAGRGMEVDEKHVLQRMIDGSPMSAVFVVPFSGSNAGKPVLLGATFQQSGYVNYGADMFEYGGNIGPTSLPIGEIQLLNDLASQLVRRLTLSGIFGIDFIYTADGDFFPLEVNPRYPASVEVLELAQRVSAIAIMRGDEPPPPAEQKAYGKAIIYAKKDCKALDLYAVFAHDQVADVPPIGAEILAGHPICTVLTSSKYQEECYDQLQVMANDVYTRGVL